jgi:hypothetical protein
MWLKNPHGSSAKNATHTAACPPHSHRCSETAAGPAMPADRRPSASGYPTTLHRSCGGRSTAIRAPSSRKPLIPITSSRPLNAVTHHSRRIRCDPPAARRATNIDKPTRNATPPRSITSDAHS